MALLQPYISNSTQGKLNLQGASITFAMNNNVSSPDFPSKITTSDVVGSTDFLGWENPVVQVSGFFDAITSPTFFNTMKSFDKSTESTVMYDPVFLTSGTQLVQISTVSFQRSVNDNAALTGSDEIRGTIVRYQLNAILTE